MSGTVRALVAQGAKYLALGDRVYEYHPGQYLVASVGSDSASQFSLEYRRYFGVAPSQDAQKLGALTTTRTQAHA